MHLESVAAADLGQWFDRPLPEDLRDLAPYVRHLSNADRMLGQLREHMLARGTPTGLCFFGDHVPILPDVYGALGEPDGDTEYFIWSNTARSGSAPADLGVEHLAKAFIDHLAAARDAA